MGDSLLGDSLLDNLWINEFEKTDKLYETFYKDNIYYLTIYFIYVNKDENIEKIKEEVFLLNDPNFISREEVIGILKRNIFINEIKYSLLSILKYNISLNPQDIELFLKSNDLDLSSDYLTVIKNIDDIYFEKYINMFQDLNNLFIIYYEKNKEIEDLKRLNNSTKKIYLKKSVNRTIRK